MALASILINESDVKSHHGSEKYDMIDIFMTARQSEGVDSIDALHHDKKTISRMTSRNADFSLEGRIF